MLVYRRVVQTSKREWDKHTWSSSMPSRKMSSIEQRETNPYDILYWLVYKDPYIGLWNNPHISWGIIFHPLYLSQPTSVKWTHLQLHPAKLTWNLENHLFEKENHLPNPHFWLPNVGFHLSWPTKQATGASMGKTSEISKTASFNQLEQWEQIKEPTWHMIFFE